MKKGAKFSLCILKGSIGLAIVGLGSVCILKYCGLRFRAWVGITFFFILALLGLAFIGGIVYTLVKAYSLPQEEKRKKTMQKVLAAGGIVVTLSGMVVLGIFILFWSAFAYEPEHVIEKHDQKMVAYVNSFRKVFVEYHEYKNSIVCGYKVMGNEFYGNGGYDPFERDPMPEPKTYEFYDSQGKLIAQSEDIPETTRENPDVAGTQKEPDSSAFPPEKMKCTFSETDVRAFCEMSYSIDGENWKEIHTGYHYQFFFGNTGYLVFSYDWAKQREAAVIYKTVDGGENWIFVSDTPTDKLLQNTVFYDGNTGIFEYGTAGTDSYVLYVTMDGASSMRKVDVPVELQGQAEEMKAYMKRAK